MVTDTGLGTPKLKRIGGRFSGGLAAASLPPPEPQALRARTIRQLASMCKR